MIMKGSTQLPAPTPVPSAGATSFSLGVSLTSTTAPGKIFSSRSELQHHYKSDWHRYNLKRREAGLPMLNEQDFALRLEAAVALRKEREDLEDRNGVAHRKDKGKSIKDDKKKKKKQGGRRKDNRRKPTIARREEDNEIIGKDSQQMEMEENSINDSERACDVTSEKMEVEGNPVDINPCQSLFDNHISTSPEANLSYMQSFYSFFLPDSEFCIDLEGFLGYCNEKVRLGNICLYCQKSFASTEGLLKHMRDKRHCKILYERGVDQEEFEVFYDFSEANSGANETAKDMNQNGWEYVDDGDGGQDTSMENEEACQEDELYDAYQSEITSQGFDITPLGELIFPDGRIVGHRGLARYYKQRFAPDRMDRAAVRHAKEAAGDRLYEGRVVNLHQLGSRPSDAGGNTLMDGGHTCNTLTTIGGKAGSIPMGRNGRGILVSDKGRGGFTSLSLYRYRAVIKKQRREDARGQRLQHRSQMNMNKMNKKGNNLTTGVVTALAPR